MKRCSSCKLEKPAAEFNLAPTPGRLRNECKACCTQRARENRRRRREGIPLPTFTLSSPPTREEVSQILSYDPATGRFAWKVTRGSMLPETEAGSVDKKGYRSIFMGRKAFKAHRVAWLLVHGVWPRDTINHKNGRKDDNWIANLEDVSASENSRHAHRTGLVSHHGERNHGAKLVAQQVLEIRASTLPDDALQAMYGVGPTTIYNIRCGKSWKSLGRVADVPGTLTT